MFFGYPTAAADENWLHNCICDAVRAIHTAIDCGKRYPGWPSVIRPSNRSQLKSRTGLRDRLKTYNRVVRKLPESERDALLVALEGENRIAELLAGKFECLTLSQLPSVVQHPVSDLFAFAFELLTDLGIRDRQYQAIYAAITDHVCPFCGVEYFDAPGAAREALDHYLTRSRYAFAGVNLFNLVPMGHKCNSSYKLAADLLHRDDGTRRVAFYPYGEVVLTMTLDRSSPFGGDAHEYMPRWTIDFQPACPEVSTWDEVFSVRVRYERDHLNPSFRGWLELIAKIARRQGMDSCSPDSAIRLLRGLEEGFGDLGLQDRGFLKSAVFRMLRLHLEAGNERLIDLICTLVRPGRSLEAR